MAQPSYSAPTRISQTTPQDLTFDWPDAPGCTLTLKFLRDECPCAGCKGENILGKVYKPLELPTFTPGMYELASVEQIGNYAIQITWRDGHHTGIYTWEYLHLLCAETRRRGTSTEQ